MIINAIVSSFVASYGHHEVNSEHQIEKVSPADENFARKLLLGMQPSKLVSS